MHDGNGRAGRPRGFYARWRRREQRAEDARSEMPHTVLCGNANSEFRIGDGLLVKVYRDTSQREDPLIVKFKWNRKTCSKLSLWRPRQRRRPQSKWSKMWVDCPEGAYKKSGLPNCRSRSTTRQSRELPAEKHPDTGRSEPNAWQTDVQPRVDTTAGRGVWLGRAVSGGGRTGDPQVGAVENAVVERAVAEHGEGIRRT